MAQMVKNVPANVHGTGSIPSQKYSLEKGTTNHFSILAWKIPWTEKPDGLQSMGSQRVRHDWATNTFTSLHITSLILLYLISGISYIWLLSSNSPFPHSSSLVTTNSVFFSISLFVCLFLMHNWPRALCYCLVYNIVPYFCILQNNHQDKSSYRLSPYKVLLPIFLTIYISSLWLIYLATGIRTSWFPSHISLIPTPYPHPTADHLFILCICVPFLLYLHICFVF